MWEVALLALGQTAGPLLKKAAERHVERFFGDRITDLTKIRKKKAIVQATESAWMECLDLIGREIQYLGDYEDADPDFKAFFGPLQEYVKQDIIASELLRPLLELDDEAPAAGVLRFGWAYLEDAPDLPEGFSWARIAERYRKSLATGQIFADELRPKLDAKNLARIAKILEGHLGVQPEADEARYAERMREMYRVLDLSAMLPPTADDRGQILLRNAFVPQKLREDPPPVELPQDLMRRLVMEGSQAKDDDDERTAKEIATLHESYSKRPPEPVLEVVSDDGSKAVYLLSDHLDGDYPFLDPLEPITEEHLKAGAKKLNVSIDEARGILAACEPKLGWSPLDPPKSSSNQAS